MLYAAHRKLWRVLRCVLIGSVRCVRCGLCGGCVYANKTNCYKVWTSPNWSFHDVRCVQRTAQNRTCSIFLRNVLRARPNYSYSYIEVIFLCLKMDLLISEVQKRAVLWNKWDPKFKDQVVVDREWDSVAKELGMSSKLSFVFY